MIVKLLVERPFCYKGTFTFFKKGHLFEVLESKQLPLMGLGFKLKDLKWNCIIDGWNNSKDFEVIEK